MKVNRVRKCNKRLGLNPPQIPLKSCQTELFLVKKDLKTYIISSGHLMDIRVVAISRASLQRSLQTRSLPIDDLGRPINQPREQKVVLGSLVMIQVQLPCSGNNRLRDRIRDERNKVRLILARRLERNPSRVRLKIRLTLVMQYRAKRNPCMNDRIVAAICSEPNAEPVIASCLVGIDDHVVSLACGAGGRDVSLCVGDRLRACVSVTCKVRTNVQNELICNICLDWDLGAISTNAFRVVVGRVRTKSDVMTVNGCPSMETWKTVSTDVLINLMRYFLFFEPVSFRFQINLAHAPSAH